jgi:hypothetical protein
MQRLELQQGETYALGFRRLAGEVKRLQRLSKRIERSNKRDSLLKRLRTKVKRMNLVVDAVIAYDLAREHGKGGAEASRERERLWAGVKFAITNYKRGETTSNTMKLEKYRTNGATIGSVIIT